jgi:hypothetical protein
LSWRSCASSSSRISRSCRRLSCTSRCVSSAAPIWLAIADSSRESPALKRTLLRRPTSVITPTVRVVPAGGV